MTDLRGKQCGQMVREKVAQIMRRGVAPKRLKKRPKCMAQERYGS